ncbi:TetR/AcrR family transcriptional regulator [Streptomyces gilvosporeus]|uniref:TetR family transcriptional regulator n=1 Tax=Streptomyces gilvosporeus TaxID=553510 RepID=A0A1V0TQH1_9ACTN|nr:TetR/AcrR family transcriptional regulator [Streptomyces gilvosporeus]ARF55185.1 TetR family transcriptional regulator [Streptomyces gilvosporeus]
MTAQDHGARRSGGRHAQRAERRAAILEAALELIAERGYRRTSLAAVAERAGLSQQGLLHHFPTKEHLLVAVLEARDRWDLASSAAAGPGSLGTDTLAQLVDYNASRPGIVQTYTVLSADSVTEDHPARVFFESRFRAVREAMAVALRAEFGDSLPGGLTPERAAPLLVAVMDGLQLQWLLDPEQVDMPAAFRDFVALLAPATGRRGED